MTTTSNGNGNDNGAGIVGANEKAKTMTMPPQSSTSTMTMTMTMTMKLQQAVLSYVRTVFGVDVRSLAVCRILLSIIILLDVMGLRLRLFDGLLPFTTNGNIISDFDFFYTEDGCLPQHLLGGHAHAWSRILGGHQAWSLFFVNVTREWAQFCFGLLLLSTITYGIGYHTRISNIVLWLMIVS